MGHGPMTHQRTIGETENTTRQRWHEFIREIVTNRRNTYLAEPRRLTSDAGIEKAASKDYSGREILEIAQNADDAATEANIKGRILFDLKEDALFIANTGNVFSEAGLESIMLAHASPKMFSRNLIGSKGLGFRSLLNWTQSPLIMSGSLEVGFHHDAAKQSVRDLLQEMPIRSNTDRQLDRHCPILSFPIWENFGAWDANIVRHGKTLRENYDTVIVIPYHSPKTRQQVMRQLEELRPRLLLFMKSVESIEISGSDFETRKLGCKKTHENLREITEIGVDERIISKENWYLRQCSEAIPEEHRAQDNDASNTLEVAVGILLGSGNNDFAPLSCYFPTADNMPFCGLFHATVELDQSRERVLRNDLNQYVLSRLAALHAKTLESISLDSGIDIDPLAFMTTSRSWSDNLNSYPEHFWTEAAKRRLILTRDGEYVSAADAIAFPNPSDDFDDRRWFRNYAQVHDKDGRMVLKNLGVRVASEDEVVDYLTKRRFRSAAHRAEVICRLISCDYTSDRLASLIVGERGGAGNASTRWFPPVSSKAKTELRPPAFMEFRFVGSSLWNELESRIEPNELVGALKPFGVTAFNLLDAVQKTLARFEDLTQRRPSRLQERGTEIIAFLASAYESRAPSLSGFDIPYPDASGNWRPASNMHLSDETSLPGRVNRILYVARPDLLAAPLETLKLEFDHKSAAAFLKWIGVNEWPATIKRPLRQGDKYLVSACYPRKISFKDKGVHEQEVGGLEIAPWGRALDGETDWIAGLEDILGCGSDHAILAWLAHRANTDLSDLATQLSIRPTPQSRPKVILEQPERSLAGEFVASRPWLRDDSGTLQRPAELILPSRGFHSLPYPLVAAPVVGPYPLGLPSSPEERSRLLVDIGVSRAPREADAPAAFRALFSVREKNAPRDEVLRLYRALSASERCRHTLGTARVSAPGTVGAQFRENGVLYAEGPGGGDWFPVKKVRFAKTERTLQFLLSERFPVLLAESRHAVFFEGIGVRSIAPSALKLIQVRAMARQRQNEIFIKQTIEERIPWLQTWCSLSDSALKTVIPWLEAEIVASARVVTNMSIEGDEVELSLPHWSSISHRDRYFVALPEDATHAEISEVALPKFWHTVADALEITGTPRNDFFGMMAATSKRIRTVALQSVFPEVSQENIDDLIHTSITTKSDEAQIDGPANWPEAHPLPDIPHQPPIPGISVENEQSVQEKLQDLRPQSTNKNGTTPEIWRREVPNARSASRLPRGQLAQSARHTHRLSLTSSGDQAEELAQALERAQNRYPLPVPGFRGESGFGCDLLSFASQKDRKAFEQTRDLDLVLRFIEVKTSDLILKLSQTRSARRFRSRYFVYRCNVDALSIEIFQDPDGWNPPDVRLIEITPSSVPDEYHQQFSQGS